MSTARWPLASSADWMEQGACVGNDPDLWHPDDLGTGRHAARAWAPARRVCRACEVRAECLRHALRLGIRSGMWGGLSPRERQRMRPDDRGERQ